MPKGLSVLSICLFFFLDFTSPLHFGIILSSQPIFNNLFFLFFFKYLFIQKKKKKKKKIR